MKGIVSNCRYQERMYHFNKLEQSPDNSKLRAQPEQRQENPGSIWGKVNAGNLDGYQNDNPTDFCIPKIDISNQKRKPD